ncbi:MAG: hypothetical protein ACI9SP_004637 [Arenicella sp.]|jgi:hypothetical protein
MYGKVSLKFAKNERQEYTQLMNDQAHSYHPEEDSLNAKVEALRCALIDRKNAQLSLKAKPDDRLGSAEEIQYALDVSENTLQKAVNSFSSHDLQQAHKDGLLASGDLVEAQAFARNIEMKNHRAQQSNDDDSHSRKL